MKMSLGKILEEIKTVAPLAEENVDEGPTNTLIARRGRKLQSQEKLKRLKEQYAQELMRSATFILVTGSSRDEFTELAKDNKCFVSDPDSFFKELVKRVPEVLYLNKEGVANVFDVMSRHLEDMALEANIVGYPQVIFKSKYNRAIKSKEDFTAIVKEALTEQMGGEITGIHAVRSLTKEAIEKSHGARITPILLPTSDESFGLKLSEDLVRLTRRVFLVVAGKSSKTIKSVQGALVVKDVTADSVRDALTKISESLKR